MVSAIVKELEAALDYAVAGRNSVMNVAWRIRHAFDRLLVFASSLQKVSGSQTAEEPLHGFPSLRHVIMGFLRSMDEITDQSGIDSDDDYEVGAYTCATLALFAGHYVAEMLELTTPESISDDSRGLHRHYEHLIGIESSSLQPYRAIYNSRRFLRVALAKDS